MTMDLTSKAFLKQREFERRLAALAFIDQDYVLQSCGWLEPQILSDSSIRKFWTSLRTGKTNIEAAEDAGIFNDLMVWIIENSFVSYATEYANQIVKYAYFAGVSVSLGKLADAVSNFDLESSHVLIDGMAKTFPINSNKPPNAECIASEFEALVLASDRSIKTGIPGLDNKTGGLERQTMSVLAGRPSMGKTAMALQIARNAVGPEYLKVAFFSLEMNRKSLWARIACSAVGLTWMDVRAKRITHEQEIQLLKESQRIAIEYGDRLHILDGRHTTDTIWQVCAQERPDLVIVDHLRRVQDIGDNENKRQGMVSEKLSNMAKELDCHVMLCVQLNREVEHRKSSKVPVLADIRDSGEIEENADQVFMLYREDYYSNGNTPRSKNSTTELWIRKFRDGVRDAQIPLIFNLEKQWFEPKYL